VTWVILSEIFPTQIRGRAMGIATICLWLANFVVSQTFPMMNDSDWLVERFHYAFPFWIYAAFCAVLVVLVWRVLPETKGKSLEEIERSWTR
jgi:SP family xylose:H+ symportor-like MFS transporter